MPWLYQSKFEAQANGEGAKNFFSFQTGSFCVKSAKFWKLLLNHVQ